MPARYAAELPRDGSQLERYAQALNAVEITPRSIDRTTARLRALGRNRRPRASASRSKCRGRSRILPGSTIAVPCSTASSPRLWGFTRSLACSCAACAETRFRQSVADQFFRDVQARIEVPVALEPRHASWFSPGMEEWLAERRSRASQPIPFRPRARVSQAAGQGLCITGCMAHRGDITRATTA